MNLSYQKILNSSILFRENLGIKKIEFGAMEPTLWKDKHRNIVNLVSELSNEGFEVAMTTNGTILYKYIKDLENSGLKKIRVSWPSFNSEIFNKITGSSYSDFLKGINLLLDSNLNFKFNRLLIKDYLEDLREHILWIRENDCGIKLHDLYWTKSNAKVYDKYYISVKKAIDENLLDIIINHKILESRNRDRQVYTLSGNSYIETKTFPKRDTYQCLNCEFISNCLEGFAEYLRIDTNERIRPCYLRDDLNIPIINYEQLNNAFSESWKISEQSLKGAKIVFTITQNCNHRCVFPDSNIAWCLIRN